MGLNPRSWGPGRGSGQPVDPPPTGPPTGTGGASGPGSNAQADPPTAPIDPVDPTDPQPTKWQRVKGPITTVAYLALLAGTFVFATGRWHTWGWIFVGIVAAPAVASVIVAVKGGFQKAFTCSGIILGILILALIFEEGIILPLCLGLAAGWALAYAFHRIVNRERRPDNSPDPQQGAQHNHSNATPQQPATSSGRGLKIGASLVVLALFVIAVTSTVVALNLRSTLGDVREYSHQLEQRIEDLEKKPVVSPQGNNSTNPTAPIPVQQPQPNANGNGSGNGNGVVLAGNPTNQQEVFVTKLLESQGITSFSYTVNEAWAASVTPGGDTFGDKPVFNEQALVSWLKTDDPRAQKVLEYFRACASHDRSQDALLFDPNSYVAVQLHEAVQWNGNLAYTNGEIYNAGSTQDPAGAVAIFYVGPDALAKNSLALCSVRGHCINPQEEVPSKPGSIAPRPNVTKPQGNGGECVGINCNPPHGGGCTEANGCKVEDCKTHPNRAECKPPVEDCKTNPNQEKCKPVEDCTTHPNKPECQPEETCETNPNRPECQPEETCEDHPNTPECQPDEECKPGDEECKPEHVKCEGVSLDEICDEDIGNSETPVQDNDPGHTAPTEGYTPGDAEETLGNQDHCIADCGLEPTEDGTVVDGSDDGGFAPGAGLEIPSDGDNPNADGSEHSTNPEDLGTSNDAHGEEAQNESSDIGGDTGVTGDPFASIFDNTEAAPQAAIVAPSSDTSAADDSSSTESTLSDLGSALSTLTGGSNNSGSNSYGDSASAGTSLTDLADTVTSLFGASGDNTFSTPSGYTGGSDGSELGSLASAMGSVMHDNGTTTGMSTLANTVTSAFSSSNGAFQGVG